MLNKRVLAKDLRKTGIACLVFFTCSFYVPNQDRPVDNDPAIFPVKSKNVVIDDPFWSPKLQLWKTVTINDVFDKFEGNYVPDTKDMIDEKNKTGRTRDALRNYDDVAAGKKNTGKHDGPPWYDGLLYETIRAAGSLLLERRDPQLEGRIDKYIERIAAAQNADSDGYINTYTTLIEPQHRFGLNGGNDTWQHDIYNTGMLAEAAVYYYNATGKTKLLDIAVKQANYTFKTIGPASNTNVIPGHAGPEEAFVKMYLLFKSKPKLKEQVSVAVNEKNYYDLAKYWIENRGNHVGRASAGYYNQDSVPVFEQKTIEGHAVRATLMATGVVTIALQDKDPKYIQAANTLWQNMAGGRMFLTGGVGAIAHEEKFGPDYFLPVNAYLETCAAVSAGFFSQKMNLLMGDGKFVDELERGLYNNIISGVSLKGDQYYYENPLEGRNHVRWNWHGCPCCPPMFLKIITELPEYIYAYDYESIYVNLFIGSKADINLNNNAVSVTQKTGYPWKGNLSVTVDPEKSGEFTVKVRIPGWATGKENFYDLYHSEIKSGVVVSVNGKNIPVNLVKGYVAIKRTWKKGDKINVMLPMEPRLVYANNEVVELRGKAALMSGPIVYGFEGNDNKGLGNYAFKPNSSLQVTYKNDFISNDGVNVIRGTVSDSSQKDTSFTAIPFYTIGNRKPGDPFKVWLPVDGNQK